MVMALVVVKLVKAKDYVVPNHPRQLLPHPNPELYQLFHQFHNDGRNDAEEHGVAWRNQIQLQDMELEEDGLGLQPDEEEPFPHLVLVEEEDENWLTAGDGDDVSHQNHGLGLQGVNSNPNYHDMEYSDDEEEEPASAEEEDAQISSNEATVRHSWRRFNHLQHDLEDTPSPPTQRRRISLESPSRLRHYSFPLPPPPPSSRTMNDDGSATTTTPAATDVDSNPSTPIRPSLADSPVPPNAPRISRHRFVFRGSDETDIAQVRDQIPRLYLNNARRDGQRRNINRRVFINE